MIINPWIFIMLNLGSKQQTDIKNRHFCKSISGESEVDGPFLWTVSQVRDFSDILTHLKSINLGPNGAAMARHGLILCESGAVRSRIIFKGFIPHKKIKK